MSGGVKDLVAYHYLGEWRVHLPSGTPGRATLCGVQESEHPYPVRTGDRANCATCYALWRTVRRFHRVDVFSVALREGGMITVVPVSGGKDSQAVLRLTLEAGIRRDSMRVVHQWTGFDHPLTYEHMRYMERRYGVKIEFTRSSKYKDIPDLISKAGYFPSSVAKACTSNLKQIPFAQWLTREGYTEPGACKVLLGMRAAESQARGNAYGGLTGQDEFSLSDIGSAYKALRFANVPVILPVVEWSTERTFAYLAHFKDKINPLYAKGHSRVGCYPCLLSRKSEWEVAVKDRTGRANIRKLLVIERRFKEEKNPRKLIKIHHQRDVEKLMRTGSFDGPNDDDQCGYCSI